MIEGQLRDHTGTVRVRHCRRANRLHERLRGLLGHPAPAPHSGLLLVPCASVHTVGMAYPIDVIFLDRRLQVVKRIDRLSPWRFVACLRAHATLELAAGEAAALELAPGLQLTWHAA